MVKPHEFIFRNRFRTHVVLPGILILFCTVLICGLGLISSGRGVDQLSIQGQKFEAWRAIWHGMDEMSLGQEAVAVCDACEVEAQSSHPDMRWLDENLGFWLNDLYRISGTFILDGKDRPIYGALQRTRVPASRYAVFAGSIGPFVDRARGRTLRDSNWNERLPGSPLPKQSSVKTSPRAVHATDLGLVNGRPAIISVMHIVPLSRPHRFDPLNTPLLVSFRYLDPAFFTEMERQNFLAAPRLSSTDRVGPGEAAVPIRDSYGKKLAYMIWKPLLPGSELMRLLLPLAVGAILIVSGTLLALAFPLRKLMAQDHERLRQLQVAQLELQASEAQTHHLAYHDPLTGLANRALFNINADQMLARVRQDGSAAAFLLLDLDRFKNVNDRFGHLAGDKLIEEVAQRLLRVLGSPEAVARLGGDEFAILLEGPAQVADLTDTLDRILVELRRPFDLFGNQAHIGVSIGVATAPECGVERTELMRKADISLYRAKDEGRDCYRFFSNKMDETVQLRSTLESDLRLALMSGSGLSVEYQPQVDAMSGKVTGLEALVRWQHPGRGPIAPHLFVPVAEETGLIVQLGEWVLRQACRVARDWPHLSMAVNLSPVQFRGEHFAERIGTIVRESGIRASQIELEVTEGVLLDNDEGVRQALRRLRREGFRIALDDFGTGYSSLSYLGKFEVDKIKIDKSFIHSLGQTVDAAAIVTAVVTLGHAMGLRVTAEGVETVEQMNFLKAAGCNEMQGFFFSRPCPAVEIAGTLQSQGLARAAA
jgi:diguanylate cyclase (GGDEF)-like protein